MSNPSSREQSREQLRRQFLDQAADAFDKMFDPGNQTEPATPEQRRQRALELERQSASWLSPDFNADTSARADRVIESPNSDSAQSVFLAWEKLRLAYNVILLGVVLLLCSSLFGWSAFQNPSFWEYLVEGVLGANLCFCIGPWLEGWLAIAGANRRVVRWVIFVPGILLACLLTGGALVLWHHP